MIESAGRTWVPHGRHQRSTAANEIPLILAKIVKLTGQATLTAAKKRQRDFEEESDDSDTDREPSRHENDSWPISVKLSGRETAWSPAASPKRECAKRYFGQLMLTNSSKRIPSSRLDREKHE